MNVSGYEKEIRLLSYRSVGPMFEVSVSSGSVSSLRESVSDRDVLIYTTTATSEMTITRKAIDPITIPTIAPVDKPRRGGC